MGLPTIPNIKPEIRLDQEESATLLLISIALEELSLAHILNAEGEKIQFVLEQHLEKNGYNICIDDILEVDQSVHKTIRNAIKTNMLLQFKLDDTIFLLLHDDDDDDEG